MRRAIVGVALLITLALVVALTDVLNLGPVAVADDEQVDPRIKIGLSIAPVELDLKGKNRALVGLGSYIVNVVADCGQCHSFPQFEPGGDPFAGESPVVFSQATYLSGGAPFFGPFVPRNLTPDASGKPAGLTLAEFRLVIRTGVDLKQIPPHVPGPGPDQDLLQVMPWPAYGRMTKRDIRAIFEYLRAIPCLEGDVAGRCG